MRIFQLFTADEARALRQQFSDTDFVDGRGSAHGYSAELKFNRQIVGSHPVVKTILAELNRKLASKADITHYAYPARLVGVRINSYRQGDSYGWHVDLANMDGFRTDLSFTVFLSDRDEYDGGELELTGGWRVGRIKQEAPSGPEPLIEVVLAADTTVAVGRRILGKPADADEARAFLDLLGGRRHRVFTAVAVKTPEALRARVVESRVQMKRLSAVEREGYIATGDWQGKAGGYSIQGPAGAFIPWISGSHSAIVGLPLAETANLLQSAGVKVWA